MENRNVSKNNFVNVTNVTMSVKETNSVIKAKHQSGVTTAALLSNSYAEAEHEHNTNFQRESIEMTLSINVKD